MTIGRAHQLNRFLSRLFQDAAAEGADSVRFVKDKSGATSTTLKARTAFASVTFDAAYFSLIAKWAAERAEYSKVPPLSERLDSCRDGVEKFPFSWNIDAIDRVVEGEFESNVALSGATTYVFKRLRFGRRKPLDESWGVEGVALRVVSAALRREPGIILLVGPRPIDLIRGLNRILSTVLGSHVGSLSEISQAQFDECANANEWAVITHLGHDPIEVLQHAKDRWGVASLGHIRLIAATASVPRVCEKCARESAPPVDALKQLPNRIRALPVQRYLVGRGCEMCNHSGTFRDVPLWSVLDLDSIRDVPEARGLDHSVLVSLLYSKGLVPLLEEGVRRAFQGSTTIESVRAVMRALPTGYENVLERLQSDSTTKLVGLGEALVHSPSGELDNRTGAKAREHPVVLVVEDDPDQREILELVLKGASYEVIAAVDGVDAWEKIVATIPDLVITDLMMPRMDGRELVAAIKGHPVLNRIPVMVLTVVADVDKEYALLDCGAEDYVEKSTQRRILLKRVASLLRRRGKQFTHEAKTERP